MNSIYNLYIHIATVYWEIYIYIYPVYASECIWWDNEAKAVENPTQNIIILNCIIQFQPILDDICYMFSLVLLTQCS